MEHLEPYSSSKDLFKDTAERWKWRKIENGVLEKAKSVPKAKEALSDCLAAKERNGIFFQFFFSIF